MAFCTTCGSNVNGAFCPQCGTPVSAAQPAPPPQAPPPQQPYSQQQYSMPPAYTPPPAQPRKMSPIVIALLVIAGLIFVCFVGLIGFGFFAARAIRNNPGMVVAKLMTAANPNIEILHTDNGAGTVTFRDRRTGKESTISFNDARNGRFSFSADDDHGGKATMHFGGGASDLPSWVPKYPGAESYGVFSAKGTDGNGSGEGGTFTFKTSDGASKVLDFYRDKAGELGLKVTMNTTTPGGGMIVAADDGEKKSLTAVANESGGSTSVNVTYGAKQ